MIFFFVVALCNSRLCLCSSFSKCNSCVTMSFTAMLVIASLKTLYLLRSVDFQDVWGPSLDDLRQLTSLESLHMHGTDADWVVPALHPRGKRINGVKVNEFMLFPALDTLVLEDVCFDEIEEDDPPRTIPSTRVKDLAGALAMRGGLRRIIIRNAQGLNKEEVEYLRTTGSIANIDWDGIVTE